MTVPCLGFTVETISVTVTSISLFFIDFLVYLIIVIHQLTAGYHHIRTHSGSFPSSHRLRYIRGKSFLLSNHPINGSVTSPGTLAEILSTSTQTISYYINGKRKSSYENIVALTKFFEVSADYLLFHVESKNLDMHKKTCLSNDAIILLELAHKQSKNSNLTDITGLLDSLLSDHDFYVFMEESTEQIDKINKLEEIDWIEREKSIPA